jgi:TonB family protein
MTTRDPLPPPEVYSTGEIARAAGVHPREVEYALEASGATRLHGRFYAEGDAVAVVRELSTQASGRPLFRPAAGVRRDPVLPLTVTGAVHLALFAGLVLMTSLGLARTPPRAALDDHHEMRLVFLATPGPGGGGGGGGGHKDPTPPPPARRNGTSTLSSPIPVRRPPPRVEPPPVVHAVERPPVKAEPLPPVVAPVVPVAAEKVDRPGIPTPVAAPPQPDSRGQGEGGGAGTGRGTGLGEGDGPGIGPGSGGGTGGGPYRPGSGITPPSIVREVKPDYTEEGRRRNLEGDVVLEIVVRRDGTVGDVKLLQGLGAGLDQRAIEAVRQWRFAPAHRLGVAVDVVVEVAMEFKLR